MILARFDDTEYPRSDIVQLRHTVRCFLRNTNGKWLVLQVDGNDIFGDRNHVETIGGGKENNESYEECLQREVLEETGYLVEKSWYIGTIIDRYYAIQRETHSHFFYATISSQKQKQRNLTEFEKTFELNIKEYTYDELIEELNHPKTRIAKLIYQRDLFALQNIPKEVLYR